MNWLERVVYGAANLIGGLLILAAVVIILYQLYVFLDSGDWLPVSLLVIVDLFNSDWVSHPTSWIGVHKILAFIPLSLSLLAVGGVMIYKADKAFGARTYLPNV